MDRSDSMSFAFDLRIALRSLRRSPVFLITAVLSLGLAIGAATAAFAVLDAVRFRVLPFPDGERLVVVGEVSATPSAGAACPAPCNVRYETYAEVLRSHAFRTLDVVAAYTSGGKALETTGGPVVVTGGVVSPNLFALLGAAPVLGRGFTADDDHLGAPMVTILSHALWTTHFGADPDILGREVQLSDTRYTVIGVMPAGFDFETVSQFWLPVVPTLDPSTLPSIRSVTVFGRLAAGATLEQLRTELSRVEPAPSTDGAGAVTRLTASPLRERYVASTQSHDVILAGIVGIVLLIACANLANLVLLRTLGQQRELAVQSALGAGAPRLIRHLLLQNVTVVLAAAVLGLLFAAPLLRLLESLAVLNSLRPRGMDYRIDLRVAAFALAMATAAAILLSALPARLITRFQVQRLLAESATTSSGGRWANRAQRIFVTAQIAAAVLLLTAAGLMTRAALRLSRADPGFAHQGLIQGTPSLPHPWRVEERYVPLFDRILADLRELRGIEGVTLRASVPLAARGAASAVFLDTGAEALPRELAPITSYSVDAAYFSTLGVPLVRGRAFSELDRRETERVVIVNEWAARRWWPGEDAVGKRLRLGTSALDAEVVTVVGVVRDNRAAAASLLLGSDGAEMYRPYAQSPSAFPTILVRVRGSPQLLLTAVRDLLVRHVPDRPVSAFFVSDRIAEQLRGVRTNALQVLGFAAVGLVLAGIGIYGVLAYAVSRRQREIAVRGVVGATPARIGRMVLLEAAALAAVAVAIGLATAASLARVVRSSLYGTSTTDPVVYLGVAVIVASLALTASYIPARRAARVAPIDALKSL